MSLWSSTFPRGGNFRGNASALWGEAPFQQFNDSGIALGKVGKGYMVAYLWWFSLIQGLYGRFKGTGYGLRLFDNYVANSPKVW